ncbi:MAG: hypothetical protein ABI949_10310 [Ilumatobacteraceae bacterium]
MFTLPQLPAIDTTKFTETARDAAYMAVGFSATVIEKTQTRLEALTSTVNDRFEDLLGVIRRAA